MNGRSLCLVVAVAVGLVPAAAWAGGYEFPDNTTEALGRGGAFTAKADSGAALQYNVAGLAQQRGTRTLVDMNLVLHQYEFTRAGLYPGNPNDPATPWAGQPFPTVRNIGQPQIGPFLAISTDFNYFKRWTFAIGVFGPSAYGHRTYPDTIDVNGVAYPNPGRYDVGKADSLIVFPTLAAAVRAAKWLDIGLALHLVAGHLTLGNTAFADLGRALCPSVEYELCDAKVNIDATAFTATAALGALFHPVKGLSFGFNLRGPAVIEARGTATPSAPKVQALPIDPSPATFKTRLPWVLRVGIRYAFLKDGFEHGDVEINGTYESWGSDLFGEGVGSQVHIEEVGPFGPLNTTISHRYRDTFSIRVGGAYNLLLPRGLILTSRIGFAFDSAATYLSETRLDFDTAAKYIPTFGLGLKVKGIYINLAYAYVYSPDRNVTQGTVRPINSFTGDGTQSTSDMSLYPAVNNGLYRARHHVISIGLNIHWDEAVKRKPRNVGL
jgi:long-subunit fatty acid transport protein